MPLDLLEPWRSDKLTAGAHRMDLYAEQVLCFLETSRRGSGGGAGRGLTGYQCEPARHGARTPRVRGLVLEMPVLERAAPAAALVFAPLLLEVHYARAALRFRGRIPSPPFRARPAASGSGRTPAAPHGVLRPYRSHYRPAPGYYRACAVLLGHGIDLIHSFSDAKRLAPQLPDARLIRTRTFAELWVRPARLTAEISEFLDRGGGGSAGLLTKPR